MSRPLTFVPGDVLPGVLDEWIGPVIITYPPEFNFGEHLVPFHNHAIDEDRYGGSPGLYSVGDRYDGVRIRLPLDRRESRHHLACVLAEGQRCSRCDGHGEIGIEVGGVPDRMESCSGCKGTGYLRPPSPVWWALPQSEGGTLPPDLAHHSAGALACSAWRVRAGLGAVRGMLGDWSIDTLCYGHLRPEGSDQYGNLAVPVRWQKYGARRVGVPRIGVIGPTGWSVDTTPAPVKRSDSVLISRVDGPETGQAGRDAADQAALAAGYALLDENGGCRWPMPEGVGDV